MKVFPNLSEQIPSSPLDRGGNVLSANVALGEIFFIHAQVAEYAGFIDIMPETKYLRVRDRVILDLNDCQKEVFNDTRAAAIDILHHQKPISPTKIRKVHLGSEAREAIAESTSITAF